MAEEDKKSKQEELDRREEERKRKDIALKDALMYIAALLGYRFSSYDELANDRNAYAAALGKLKQSKSLLDKVLSGKKLSSQQMNEEIAKLASEMSRYAKVVTVGDSRVCESCRKWQGKVVSLDGSDSRYPSLDEYLNEAVHPNCRCSLQPVKRAGNSSFKRKNAVLNNFDGHAFKYISNHE